MKKVLFLFNTYKNEGLKEKKELIEKKSDVKFVKLKPKELIQEKEIEPKSIMLEDCYGRIIFTNWK